MKSTLRAAAKTYVAIAASAGILAFYTDTDCFGKKTRLTHATFLGIFWPFWSQIEELEKEAEAKKVFPVDLLYILVPRTTHKEALRWLKSPSRHLGGRTPIDALGGDATTRETVYQAAEDFVAPLAV